MSDINEQFHYNIMLAKALVQLMPEQDRQYMKIWFNVLMELDKNEEQLAIRHEYIWFILIMLQNNKIEQFFKELPPNKIEPLRKALCPKVVDEVLLACDQNHSWLENVTEEEKLKSLEKRKVNPELFMEAQPCPKEGIICYFGAFSDQFT